MTDKIEIDMDNLDQCEVVLQDILSNPDHLSKYDKREVAELIVKATNQKWHATALEVKRKMKPLEIRRQIAIGVMYLIGLTVVCLTVWACQHTDTILYWLK